MAEIKDLLRERLQGLSKEELIDIIADIASVYVRASVLGRMSGANCIQQCVNNVQTDILNEQKVNNSLFSQPIVSKCAELLFDPSIDYEEYRELQRRGNEKLAEEGAEMFRSIEESRNRLCEKAK
jgi:hypothetical protein